MMLRTRSVFTIGALALALAGCATQAGRPSAAAPAATNPGTQVTGIDGVEGDVVGTPNPGSKFARVKIGMSEKEATDLIGQPTDQSGHITGKAFIPFFFGGDTNRIEAFYKGEGVLTYSPRSFGSTAYVLIGITVNPAERGYAS